MKWNDLKALFDSFADLSADQQETVARYVLKQAVAGEKQGGLSAGSYLGLMICDVPRAGGHRQSFLDAVARVGLSSWEPDAAHGC